jgi:hypothetical protein
MLSTHHYEIHYRTEPLEALMNKRYLYVVLLRTNTFLSRSIHILKKDKYTHAMLATRDDLVELYSFARKSARNPFIGGFKCETVSGGVYCRMDELPGAIIRLAVTAKQFRDTVALIEQFKARANYYKYNYIGMLSSGLVNFRAGERRFFCSEFVYYVLCSAGIVDFGIPRHKVRPQMLMNLGGKIIYEGDLHTYYWHKQQQDMPSSVYDTLPPFDYSHYQQPVNYRQ